MNFFRLYQIVFMGLLLVISHVSAMNVQKNYAFAIKDCDSEYCIPQEDYDRELPYLLPGKKHNSFLTQTLYGEFINVTMLKAMNKKDKLPAEIISLIMEKILIMANQDRKIFAEQVLQERYTITYRDLCYLTKAQKQLLLYCVTDALYNNGMLTIEGDNEKFSREMLERFFSLPIAIQAKLSHHAHGTSMYVKTDYMQPSFSNRLLGKDVTTRNRNIKCLASTIKIITPVALLIILILAAAKTVDKEIMEDISKRYENLAVMPVKMACAMAEKALVLRIPNFVVISMAGMAAGWGLIAILSSPYIVLIGAIVAVLKLSVYVEDCFLNGFNQTLPEVMRLRGFKEVVVTSEELL